MSAKTIAAPLPSFAEAPSLLRPLRNATHWLVQRFTRAAGSAERALVLEDRVAIGPKKALVVVRCHGQRFLVGTAGDTIGPLIEIVPPQSVSRAARRSGRERKA